MFCHSDQAIPRARGGIPFIPAKIDKTSKDAIILQLKTFKKEVMEKLKIDIRLTVNVPRKDGSFDKTVIDLFNLEDLERNLRERGREEEIIPALAEQIGIRLALMEGLRNGRITVPLSLENEPLIQRCFFQGNRQLM